VPQRLPVHLVLTVYDLNLFSDFELQKRGREAKDLTPERKKAKEWRTEVFKVSFLFVGQLLSAGVQARVARFFLVSITQTGKMYQMNTKCTK
jgi:hypothetical protein